MSKKLGIKIIIALCILLCGIFLLDKYEQSQRAKRISKGEEELEQVQDEIDALQQTINESTASYNEEIAGTGTVSLIFTDLDQTIINNAEKELSKADLTGTIALSEKQYPGMAGNISRKTFDKLMDDGWSYCLYWDGTLELDEWLPKVKKALKGKKIQMPKALYCVSGEYNSKYDKTIKSYDINIVIHHGESNMAVSTTEMQEDLWHIGSVGWNMSETDSTIPTAINESRCLTLAIGSDTNAETYDEEAFEEWAEKLGEWNEKEDIFVIDLFKARDYRLELYNKKEDLEEEQEKLTEENQAKLAELNEKKQNLFDSIKWK